MVIGASSHNRYSGNFTNVPTNFVRNIFLHQTDYYKLYQKDNTIHTSWIRKFAFNLKLLKGTHHNTTLNTDYVEHLVLSDYNLPESNDSSQNNFSKAKRYLLKKNSLQEAHAFNF
jgi:hypothetical protein